MKSNKKLSDKESFVRAGEDLLRKVREAEPDNRHEAMASWQEIEARLGKPQASSSLRIWWAVAASVALLILFSLYPSQHPVEEDTSLSLALLSDTPVAADEIVLISTKEKMQLKDDASIIYDVDGQSDAGGHVVSREASGEKEQDIDQLIVPLGRRANITFADGTKMYVNAGSRVLYPAVFRKDKREIVVEGEVYLEVAKDASRPFIVKTNGIDVKVLGTRFNVSAYQDDVHPSVVLVDGRVEVSAEEAGKSVLSPGQRLELNGKTMDVRTVDVEEYICWKDDMMQLKERTLGEIVERLSRYYGRQISCDEATRRLVLSGKLDLRDNVEEVVSILCRLLFLQYKVDENNQIILSK